MLSPCTSTRLLDLKGEFPGFICCHMMSIYFIIVSFYVVSKQPDLTWFVLSFLWTNPLGNLDIFLMLTLIIMYLIDHMHVTFVVRCCKGLSIQSLIKYMVYTDVERILHKLQHYSLMSSHQVDTALHMCFSGLQLWMLLNIIFYNYLDNTFSLSSFLDFCINFSDVIVHCYS